MKTLVTTLLIFALSATLMAKYPTDGFYEMTIDPTLKNKKDKNPGFGYKREFKIRKVQLYATDNLNTRFNLIINIPYYKGLDKQRYVLLVNKNIYKQDGSGRSGNEFSFLSFTIKGRKHAENIAKYFFIQPRYRKHPGYRFAVTFTPDKKLYKKGEEIWVTLNIKNVGTKAIAFQKGGRNRAPRDNQYVFSGEFNLKSPLIDIGSSNNFGGLSTKRVIKPGETFKDRVNLTKWFRFDKKGWYKILGSYYMAFYDLKGKTYNTIWEDYVSDEFYFNVQ